MPASADLISVFIRGSLPRARLEELGARPGNSAGEITTAVIAVRDIPLLASEPRIDYVELARPLRPD